MDAVHDSSGGLALPTSASNDWLNATAFNNDYEGFPWLWAFICFITMLTIFEQYLNLRQMRQYCASEIPDKVKALNIVSEEEFSKSQHYSRDKMMFGMVMKALDTALMFIFLVMFVYPKVWTVAGMAVGSNEYSQSLMFCLMVIVYETVKGIPPSLYFDFVIEERHGFNKKTFGLFFVDQAKEFVLVCVIGAPIISAVIWIIRWGGPAFYVYLWAFAVVTGLVMMIVYPNFIAPLFNKYEPLEDESLRIKIERLAGELRFPLTKLYQVDASKRSSHSNAYFYGIWKWKRIVLFDTLLDSTHDQILAILAHELGHWKLNHMPKGLAISFTHLFMTFYLYGLVMTTASLYESFGFGDTRACIVGLLLFTWILSPVESVMSLFITWITRRHEFQADEFAVKLGFCSPLKTGLVTITKKSKASVSPDKWYAFYHYTHPPLVERLDAITRRNEELMTSGSSERHPLLDGKEKAEQLRKPDDDGSANTGSSDL